MSTYQTEDQIRAIVEGFESCNTNKADFKHQDHLTVAVSYLQSLTVTEAAQRLREALLRFVDHHQVDRRKYNETITIFWLELVAEKLKGLSPSTSLIDQCNAVLDSLSNAGLPMEYYSAELLFSDQAREAFVEPDLKQWKRN